MKVFSFSPKRNKKDRRANLTWHKLNLVNKNITASKNLTEV